LTPPGRSPTSVESRSRPATAALLIAQAYIAWLLWTLRSISRASVSWAAYAALLARQLAAIGLGERGSAIRLLLDETVARLRDLGDLSVQEAQSLRKVLLELAAELRQLDSETLDEPRRYAKAKP
jgi:hypothetical protein